ncbi:MAG TPA: 2-dehydropantoate 2-reductase [Allosphingosinicella sp.]|nr:2-dehydropantoate 2-reductase [Allosphingosinicella sp.]
MPARASIALIGPGAIGGTVAAWLARAHEVAICARTAFETLRVETPDGMIEARPRLLTDPADAVRADWVLIATKAYDCEGAAAWLPALVGPATRVAVLQNGVEHAERFAPWLDAARIVPAVVDIPAERDAPGRIRQRRFGTIVVREGAEDFVALFAHSPIAVSTTADFATVAWKKLALNCAGVVNGLTMKPAGVSRDPAIVELMRGLVAECIAVGRAEGAALDDGLIEEVVDHYRNAPADSVNSLLADRMAGRPTEIDARNGVIVRLGERHGLAAPLNALAVALIKAAQ